MIIHVVLSWSAALVHLGLWLRCLSYDQLALILLALMQWTQ